MSQFHKKIMAVLCSLLIGLCSISTAFAETSLPDGAVKGLPERLAALDDEGNPVNSETGEYFFHVENMQFGETYTKNVQLINLREDASFHIYFYVEPIFKKGEIDLEEGCECRFYLDGEEFYKGSVTGDGSIDLTRQHFDCGYYNPGTSHTLRAEVVWNDFEPFKSVDNGWRMVDKDGVHILIDPDGNAHTSGEIEFRWVFYSVIDEPDASPDEPDKKKDDKGGYAPQTGIQFKNGTIWLIGIGVVAAAVVVLLILIIRSKKKDKNK